MTNQWQHKLFHDYLANILTAAHRNPDWAAGIYEHLERAEILGGDLDDIWRKLEIEQNAEGRRSSKVSAHDYYRGRKSAPPKRIWTMLIERNGAARASVRRARPDPVEQNLREFAAYMELGEEGLTVLRLLLTLHVYPRFRDLLNCVRLRSGGSNDFDVWGATILGMPLSDYSLQAGPRGQLVGAGLIVPCERGCGHGEECVFSDSYQISSPLVRALCSPRKGILEMLKSILGEPALPSLGWDDFVHLGKSRDYIERIIAQAMEARQGGVNILLYGPPGTGKTEFCRVLGGRVGGRIYLVGEDEAENVEPDRNERMLSLRLAQRLLARDPQAIILLDEMDDVIRPASIFSREQDSKIYIHRLLETNQTPTLWACNDISGISDAVLRRMTMAVEVRLPPAPVRKRVWHRILERHNLVADDAVVERLAQEFEAAPGVAEQAVRASILSGDGVAALPDFVRGLSKAMRGGVEHPPNSGMDPADFDPALTNMAPDAEGLLARLAMAGKGSYSLCLSGPPGTGKSAFARAMAARLGLPALVKRASDLLSMFVGGTEQQIAAAFQEARDAGAVLIFDEADSLLGDRRAARHSWEIAQVNEMLTWMECHTLPFVCTTNFSENLDTASLRRFTFKLEFNYLTPAQAAHAFRQFFSLEPPVSIAALDRLTPGDFAVVRRKAGMLDLMADPDGLVQLLADECRAKPGARTPLGFLAIP